MPDLAVDLAAGHQVVISQGLQVFADVPGRLAEGLGDLGGVGRGVLDQVGDHRAGGRFPEEDLWGALVVDGPDGSGEGPQTSDGWRLLSASRCRGRASLLTSSGGPWSSSVETKVRRLSAACPERSSSHPPLYRLVGNSRPVRPVGQATTEDRGTMTDTRRSGGIPFALVPVLGLGGWFDVSLLWWVVVFLAGVVVGVLATLTVQRELAAWRGRQAEQAVEQANDAIDREDWEEADGLLQQALRLQPGDSEIWYLRGYVLAERGRYLDCLKFVNNAPEGPGLDPWESLYLKTLAALRVGNTPHVASGLERMAREHPGWIRTFVKLEDIDLEEVAPALKKRLDFEEARAASRNGHV